MTRLLASPKSTRGKGGRERTRLVGRGGSEVFRPHVGLSDYQPRHLGVGHGGSDEELIANPFCGRGANIERADQPDGHSGS